MNLADIFPKDGRPQRLYCETCGSSMDLGFDDFSELVSGVQIDIRDLPFLHCHKCESRTLPDKSRVAIIQLHKQAVEKLSDKVTVRRSKITDDFGFSKVPFLMDADDYFYIPGLYREHDVGFLTPIFFNKAVLTKYDNSPNYSVRFASPTYGDIDAEGFAIPFGINRFGKVIMWLGDISKLPEAEQYYLRSENVASDHSMGSEFYDAQIECEFTKPPKERLVIGQRSNFLDAFEKKFGVRISHLDTELVETITALAPPLLDTEKERRHTFDSLNRIFIESLDNAGLEKLIKSLGTTSAGSGSLKRLQAVLETVDATGAVSTLLSPFYVLYDLRIAYTHALSARKKADLIDASATRLGLAPDFDLPTVYDELLKRIAASLKDLTEHVK